MVDAVQYLYDFEGSDDLGNGDFSVIVHIADEYASLESRLAELEKDAARYRWLRGNCQEVADYHATSGQLYFGTYGWGELDSEIDEAMSRES